MSKTLIGITGRKGVGKSTLASMLRDEISGAEIVAFADALKDDVAAMIADIPMIVPPIGRAWLDAHKGTVFGPLCQGYGSLMREAIHPDYWVDVLARETEDLDAVIIPDVRYANEAHWVKVQGGLLVAIDGPSRWEGDQRDTSHPSETGVDATSAIAHIVIHNTGNLELLRSGAYFAIDSLNHIDMLSGRFAMAAP